LNPFRQLKRYLIYSFKKKIDIDKDNNLDQLNIDNLFTYFNTDKGKVWRDGKSTGHGYSPYYEKHFKKLRNKKINILEIGSYAGASAASFAKYFSLPTIYCLDINITNFKYSSKKIKVFSLDVSKKSMVNKFYKKINISNQTEFFDIIIDDGSHKLSHTLSSLNIFFKNLKPGGYYVIEDYKFPNYHPHLKDCSENTIDIVLNFIKNKIFFKSDILNSTTIKNLIDLTEEIFKYRGLLEISDIAFIKKLN